MTVPAGGMAALDDGREALRRGDWTAARTTFEALVAAEGAAEALEGLSRATWWQGDPDATLAARERAYHAYRQRGDVCGAARMAAWLGSDHIDFRGDDAVGAAWLRRARTLLDGAAPCAELGWVSLLEADLALLVDADPETARTRAASALTLARGLGDRDLEVVAAAIMGSAEVASGAVEEGLRRLDEAAALAVGEQFGEALAPGWALCHTVSSCAEVGDFDRAEQWSRMLRSFAQTWTARHFFGVCRTAYGGVLVAHGEWGSADEELTGAMADLRAVRPGLSGPTAVRLGELRVRQGRLDEARTLFEAALPLASAAVALGELELAAGDAAHAAHTAERVLRRLERAGDLERLRPLELLARAHAATGDMEAARAVAHETQQATTRLGTDYLRARGALVTAEVLCAAGDADAARQAAEDAADLFTACSAPYDTARARRVLSRALSSLGLTRRAEAEDRAARKAMAALGVPADALRTDATRDDDALSPRELDVLRLVARGLSDAEIAERLVVSPHTVHRHVANVRTKLRVPSRSAAVAQATRAGLL